MSSAQSHSISKELTRVILVRKA